MLVLVEVFVMRGSGCLGGTLGSALVIPWGCDLAGTLGTRAVGGGDVVGCCVSADDVSFWCDVICFVALGVAFAKIACNCCRCLRVSAARGV